MNDSIFEAVVSTAAPDGRPNISPLGVRWQPDGGVLLMPFAPSTTLDNILATRAAVLNLSTDVRVIAGCVTGRKDWPLVEVPGVPGVANRRLADTLRHVALELVEVTERVQEATRRPVLRLRALHDVSHAPWPGFKRAQAAVLEGAVLISRLHLLPRAKVEAEMAYLQIAIDKTADAAEREAWGWLQDAVRAHHAATPAPQRVTDPAAPEGGR